MKKSILYLTLLFIISLFVTACGGRSVNEPPPPSPSADKDSAVSGSAISKSQINKGRISPRIAIRNPYIYDSDAAFIIKIKTHRSIRQKSISV